MKTVVITRKYWGKGSLRVIEAAVGETPSKNDKKCCLGFVCESYGVNPVDTANRGMPYELAIKAKEYLPDWLKFTTSDSSSVVEKMATINDAQDLTWAKKEEKLKPLFLEQGIRLVFRGKRR